MILDEYDALGLAELIKNKMLTTDELLELSIKRLQTLQPQLNCVSHYLFDYGRKQLAKKLPDGPFSGVPFLLKNLSLACKDTPLTEGSDLLAEMICGHDDEVLKRFKKAGLVFFGRSNAPEFGFSFTTEPKAHGVTHNPWNLKLSPGGSSGGAAAAVAARISPIAHASDGGGSIRVPASCCGIFGFKPSRARVPAGPKLGEAWGGFATHHVLTLSVRDSAAMLDCISGPELGDPYFAPEKKSSYLHCLNQPVGKLRIGILKTLKSTEKMATDVEKSFSESVTLLQDLGHELEEIELKIDIDNLRKAFIIIASSCLSNKLQVINKNFRQEKLEAITLQLLKLSEQLKAFEYVNAVQTLHQQCREIAKQFATFDVIMMPTTAQSARPLGTLAGNTNDLGLYNAKQLKFSPYTALANMTGQPAMSVPLHWSEKNIPIGTQFLAPFGHEQCLFQLAKQLEEAKPWFNKRPKLLEFTE